METLLTLFYILLFLAILFFGPLQEFVYRKKAEWDLKKRSGEEPVESSPAVSAPADPERTGFLMAIVLIALALVFFIWKILTTGFTPV